MRGKSGFQSVASRGVLYDIYSKNLYNNLVENSTNYKWTHFLSIIK